jgi:hypothetical protein
MAIKFHSDIESSGDLALYNPVNDGNPVLSLGKDANDRAEITAEFHGSSQTFNRLRFRTFSSSTSSNAGRINFQVDEVSIGEFKDTGFNINSAKSLMVEGDDIITGNGSGVCTLSNIDALDATTTTTIEDAIDVSPNLYWFANCDAATVGAASNGSFPATNTTDVSFTQTHNNGTAGEFVLSSDELTIARAGLYKITYNVTLEVGAGSTAVNRAGGAIALLRKEDRGTYAVVAGTESYIYCRTADIKTNTGSTSVIYDVTADDVFKIVFLRTGALTATSKLGTVTAGTAWTVEAIS